MRKYLRLGRIYVRRNKIKSILIGIGIVTNSVIFFWKMEYFTPVLFFSLIVVWLIYDKRRALKKEVKKNQNLTKSVINFKKI